MVYRWAWFALAVGIVVLSYAGWSDSRNASRFEPMSVEEDGSIIVVWDRKDHRACIHALADARAIFFCLPQSGRVDDALFFARDSGQ